MVSVFLYASGQVACAFLRLTDFVVMETILNENILMIAVHQKDDRARFEKNEDCRTRDGLEPKLEPNMILASIPHDGNTYICMCSVFR